MRWGRPKHITSCTASGTTAFSTWHIWKSLRKLTHTSLKRTGHEPLSTGSNVGLNPSVWIWFSKDNPCDKPCWDVSFGFQLFAREGKKCIWRVCHRQWNYFNIHLHQCFFQCTSRNTLRDAGLEERMLGLNRCGKCHFRRFSVPMNTMQVLKKLCSLKTSISQYYLITGLLTISNLITARIAAHFLRSAFLDKTQMRHESFRSLEQPFGKQSSGSSDSVIYPFS